MWGAITGNAHKFDERFSDESEDFHDSKRQNLSFV